MINATLRSDVPAVLEVGLGNVLLVEGTVEPAVIRLEVSVGHNHAPTFASRIPPPGERHGRSWWQAIVPIEPVAEGADVAISITAGLSGGDETPQVLGELRLEPGVAPDIPSSAGTDPELVAICMATHEPPPDLLRAQIESIQSQTHQDWLCVVSDDASGPEARSELERASGGDSRFKLLFHEDRLGAYRNFERALRAIPPGARYVALSDQDDRWHPDKLAALVAALGPGDVLAHSDARVIDANGRVIAPTFWPRRAPRDDDLAELMFANAVTGASALFRTTALRWILPLPGLAGRAFHDRWIALVSKALGGISYVDRPLYDYVQHAGAAHGHQGAVGTRRAWAAFRPDWRAAHDDYLARSVSEAIAIRLRSGDRLSDRELRRLRTVETFPSSGVAQARAAIRHLTRRVQGQPGLEGALLRAVLWRRLVPVRNAMSRRTLRPARRAAPPLKGGARARSGHRYGITVTRDSQEAGFGDYFTAHELGSELERLGVEVTYLELDSWRSRRRARSLDVIVSLLDRFPIDHAPDETLTVAWVRNWTERWIEREWFARYDLLFASSDAARDLITRRSVKEAELMPLATNPRHFAPRAKNPDLAADVTFVGNRSGVDRDVQDVLPRLAAAGLEIKVFGRGWDPVPGMRELCLGSAPYESLPEIYSSAALVVDDSGPHTRPYGAVNSRVFDALACGAYVASNDAPGVAALLGEEFPTWRNEVTLRAQAEYAREHPDEAQARIAPLRRDVLQRHTYASRAKQLHERISALTQRSTSSSRRNTTTS